MGHPVKILVVEDEMPIAAKISMLLTNLGYDITGIFARGEEAVVSVKENIVDLILLDINLKGEIDGIETSVQIHRFCGIPVIYLTANGDDATFNRAKITKPAGFIARPFKSVELQRAIELAICRMAENESGQQTFEGNNEVQHFILSDRIFVRNKEKMIKILVSDILYVEADRNYSRIFTPRKEYLLSVTLKTIQEKLPENVFVRVHRSYMININQVEEVADSYVIIGKKPIPMSAGLKEQLLKRIKTL